MAGANGEQPIKSTEELSTEVSKKVKGDQFKEKFNDAAVTRIAEGVKKYKENTDDQKKQVFHITHDELSGVLTEITTKIQEDTAATTDKQGELVINEDTEIQAAIAKLTEFMKKEEAEYQLSEAMKVDNKGIEAVMALTANMQPFLQGFFEKLSDAAKKDNEYAVYFKIAMREFVMNKLNDSKFDVNTLSEALNKFVQENSYENYQKAKNFGISDINNADVEFTKLVLTKVPAENKSKLENLFQNIESLTGFQTISIPDYIPIEVRNAFNDYLIEQFANKLNSFAENNSITEGNKTELLAIFKPNAFTTWLNDGQRKTHKERVDKLKAIHDKIQSADKKREIAATKQKAAAEKEKKAKGTLDGKISLIRDDKIRKDLETRSIEANRMKASTEKTTALSALETEVAARMRLQGMEDRLVAARGELLVILNGNPKKAETIQPVINEMDAKIKEIAEFKLDPDASKLNASLNALNSEVVILASKVNGFKPKSTKAGGLDHLVNKAAEADESAEGFDIGKIIKDILRAIMESGFGDILVNLGFISKDALEKAGFKKVGGKWMENPGTNARVQLEDTIGIAQEVWNQEYSVKDNYSRTVTLPLKDMTVSQFTDLAQLQDDYQGSDKAQFANLVKLRKSLNQCPEAQDANNKSMNALMFIQIMINRGRFNDTTPDNLFKKQEEAKKTAE